MGLRHLTLPSATVELPGGEHFTVRGVNPDMVVALYNRHRGELGTLFDGIVAGGELDRADVGMLAGQLMGAAPHIMGELIALASGSTPGATHVDPDIVSNPQGLTDWEQDVSAARNLPLPTQIDALMKIAEQTFTASMPVGKFLAVVIKAAGATTAALTARKN